MSKAAAAKRAKKGLSMEEKTAKVIAWFHAHPQPYTLKELLLLIPRATGVIYQSVEECVELVVSEDHHVYQDKVGVHTLFWCFPLTPTQKLNPAGGGSGRAGHGGGGGTSAAAAAERARRLELQQLPVETLRADVAALVAREEQLQEQLAAAAAAVGGEEQTKQDAMRLTRLTQQRAELLEKKKQLALFDPDVKLKLHESIQLSLEAANQWTENFFLLEQYIKEKMQRSSRDVRCSVSVPEQLDFIEAEDILPPPPAAAVTVFALTPSRATVVAPRVVAPLAVPVTARPQQARPTLASAPPPVGVETVADGSSPVKTEPPAARHLVARSPEKGTVVAATKPQKRGRKNAPKKVPTPLTTLEPETTKADGGETALRDGVSEHNCHTETDEAESSAKKTKQEEPTVVPDDDTTLAVSSPPPLPQATTNEDKRKKTKGTERKRTRCAVSPSRLPSIPPEALPAAPVHVVASEEAVRAPASPPEQNEEGTDSLLVDLLAQVEQEEDAMAKVTNKEVKEKKRRGRPPAAPKKK